MKYFITLKDSEGTWYWGGYDKFQGYHIWKKYPIESLPIDTLEEAERIKRDLESNFPSDNIHQYEFSIREEI